jgi:UDP-glucose 6-dehydrogenase
MKIAMIGTGYVGLVSGVCFSDFGHDVVCVDRMPEKIAMLERGEVPIYEPGLDALMARNVEAGRLAFTTDLAAAVDGADAVFIAVGTPTRRGDGHADLSYVMEAAEEVARALTGYAVIVTKSTVISKLRDMCDDSFNGKVVAVLGVTFKPNTDDMRDAPSLTIIPALVGGGARVRVVDPQGRREGEALLPGVVWGDDPYKAAHKADLLVILTEWNEFRALDLKRLRFSKGFMSAPVLARPGCNPARAQAEHRGENTAMP